jgi:hypothetical protein
MAEMSAGTAAAERLLAEKDALASAITSALYAEMPELQEKYGDYGRRKCLEDMRYNLEHLAPAVDLADPAMFVAYVRWLEELLRARKVDGREIARSLRLTEEILRQRLPSEQLEAVLPSLRAGVDALPTEATP